jgi:hypothetical protein
MIEDQPLGTSLKKHHADYAGGGLELGDLLNGEWVSDHLDVEVPFCGARAPVHDRTDPRVRETWKGTSTATRELTINEAHLKQV